MGQSIGGDNVFIQVGCADGGSGIGRRMIDCVKIYYELTVDQNYAYLDYYYNIESFDNGVAHGIDAVL